MTALLGWRAAGYPIFLVLAGLVFWEDVRLVSGWNLSVRKPWILLVAWGSFKAGALAVLQLARNLTF